MSGPTVEPMFLKVSSLGNELKLPVITTYKDRRNGRQVCRIYRLDTPDDEFWVGSERLEPATWKIIQQQTEAMMGFAIKWQVMADNAALKGLVGELQGVPTRITKNYLDRWINEPDPTESAPLKKHLGLPYEPPLPD